MLKASGAFVVGAAVLVGGLGAASPAAAQQHIKIDGSSTVYPVTEAVAEEFGLQSRGKINVTVGISGTGGGFKKFTRGETDISDASRPILKSEMDAARENNIEYIELPVCFDALTVVVSKGNTFVDHLTVSELKKMWEPSAQGTITTWNQIRPEWPADKIELYGPGPDSGTFDYFTEAVMGKSKASRGDYTGSEDDNVLVRGVEGSKYAIGYFGFAYYAAHQDKLRAVPILWDGKATKAVSPSRETVENGTYAPLSRPIFIYVNKKSAEEKPYVRDFVRFYLDNAPTLSAEVKYVPLPAKAYEMIKSRFSKLETGTAFAGEAEVGLPIEELLKKELKK